MENVRIIREGLQSIGFNCFGGVNAPYIWAQTPSKMGSWEYFITSERKKHCNVHQA